MSAKVITFEVPEDTLRAFDNAAASVLMSREQAIKGLMESYLSHDRAFRASVATGIDQADDDNLIGHEEIETRLERWERETETLVRSL